MVRGDDQERVVPFPDGLQPLDEAPELIVLVRHRLVVEATGEIEVGVSTDAGLLERVGVGWAPPGRLELARPLLAGCSLLRIHVQPGKGWNGAVRSVDVGGLEMHPVRAFTPARSGSPETVIADI